MAKNRDAKKGFKFNVRCSRYCGKTAFHRLHKIRKKLIKLQAGSRILQF